MANLGFRNSWPQYKRERGDYVEPHVVGNPKSNWDRIEKKVQRLEVAQAVGAQNKSMRVVDRGKPLYLVELDKLFVQLEKVQRRSKGALLRHRAKTALVDLAGVRSKLSTTATVGKKPTVSFSEYKVVKHNAAPTQEQMAALTRREVALFKSRWASLLS